MTPNVFAIRGCQTAAAVIRRAVARFAAAELRQQPVPCAIVSVCACQGSNQPWTIPKIWLLCVVARFATTNVDPFRNTDAPDWM